MHLWELSVLSISTCNDGSLVDMCKVPLPFNPFLMCPFAWNHKLIVSTMYRKGIVTTETLKILGPSKSDPDHCVIAAPLGPHGNLQRLSTEVLKAVGKPLLPIAYFT